MDPLKELLYKMADDAFIIGNRYAEWIGMGPVLEEDIALGSIAQDKTGHAFNLYNHLYTLGEANPDKIAYYRPENEFKCCHFVELPSMDYSFTLMRHFLFDHAEFERYTLLQNSTYGPLSDLAKKYRPEIKYHVFHADTWITQLSKGNEESHARMQSALNEAWPLAKGIFEESPSESELISKGIFAGEKSLRQKLEETVIPILEKAGLKVPKGENPDAMGGRNGYHTEHLKPMLEEISEVIKSDEDGIEW